MSQSLEPADERTRLLQSNLDRRRGPPKADENVSSISHSSYVNRGDDWDLFTSDPDERLPYNSFATVDLLRDLVKYN